MADNMSQMARSETPRRRPRLSEEPARDAPETTEELRHFRNLLVHGRLGSYDYTLFLGLSRGDFGDLLREVRRGFPFRAFERLRRNTTWEAAILASLLDIPERTLSRRKQE